MRRLLLVVLVTVLAVAGCSGVPRPEPPPTPPPAPSFVLVELGDDLTDARRAAVADRLRAAPGPLR